MPELSRPEHAVMHILWQHQPLSVREVHDRLDNDWAYTTTKTVMDRLVKKGLLARGSAHGVNVYRAQVSRPEGLVKLVRHLAEKVLEINYDVVVNLFADSKIYSEEELEELRDLIERDQKPDSSER